MNKNDREQFNEFRQKLETINDKVDRVNDKLRKLENKLDKKQNKLKKCCHDLSFGIMGGLIPGLIILIIIAPTLSEFQELQQIRNLEFEMRIEEIIISENDVSISYNFSGLNKNDEICKKDIKLSVTFYENDSLTVRNCSSYNSHDVKPSIVDNSIIFIWDIIPKKEGTEAGEIYIAFEVNRHKPEGNISISSDKKPEVIVEIEDFDKVYVEEPPFPRHMPIW